MGPDRPPRPRRGCASGSAGVARRRDRPGRRAAGRFATVGARRPPRRPRRARRGAGRQAPQGGGGARARRRSRRPTAPAVLAAARDLRARVVRPGDGEVPRAGHGRQPARVQPSRRLPTRNFQAATFAGAPRLAAEDARRGPRGGAQLLRRLHDRLRAHLQARQDGRQGRVEYENLFALGPLCGVSDPDAVLAAARRCDELGLDTISAGGTVAFAMECAERGLIDAPWLRFGDGDALLRVLDEIGRARGPRATCWPRARARAAPAVGGEARRLRPARQGAGDPRLRAAGAADDGARASRSAPAGRTTTAPGPTRSTSPAATTACTAAPAHGAARGRDRGPRGPDGLADPVQVPARRLRRSVPGVGGRLLGAVTGWDVTATSCEATARRIVPPSCSTLREGWTPAEDTLPERFLTETLELESGRSATLTPSGCTR